MKTYSKTCRLLLSSAHTLPPSIMPSSGLSLSSSLAGVANDSIMLVAENPPWKVIAKCVASTRGSGKVRAMWAGVEREVHCDSPVSSGTSKDRLLEPVDAGEVLRESALHLRGGMCLRLDRARPR